MVEDDGVGLALGRTQHAPNHLPIEPHPLGRPSENGAADLGHVPALREDHAVGHKLGLAGGQARQDGVALVVGRGAVEMFGAYVRTDKLVFDVDRMRNIASEGDGLPALAEFVPIGNDIADELGVVHSGGKFGLDVVTVADMDAAQIWLDRRVDTALDQPTALLDEVRNLRALYHGGEDSAETTAVATTGCGREPDQD